MIAKNNKFVAKEYGLVRAGRPDEDNYEVRRRGDGLLAIQQSKLIDNAT